MDSELRYYKLFEPFSALSLYTGCKLKKQLQKGLNSSQLTNWSQECFKKLRHLPKTGRCREYDVKIVKKIDSTNDVNNIPLHWTFQTPAAKCHYTCTTKAIDFKWHKNKSSDSYMGQLQFVWWLIRGKHQVNSSKQVTLFPNWLSFLLWEEYCFLVFFVCFICGNLFSLHISKGDQQTTTRRRRRNSMCWKEQNEK